MICRPCTLLTWNQHNIELETWNQLNLVDYIIDKPSNNLYPALNYFDIIKFYFNIVNKLIYTVQLITQHPTVNGCKHAMYKCKNVKKQSQNLDKLNK
jgi:hypothetical protein